MGAVFGSTHPVLKRFWHPFYRFLEDFMLAL
jgi:hypothetical protein